MSGDAEEVVFPSLLRFTSVEFDDVGFRPDVEKADSIPWCDVAQVAVTYEIHPVAIVDETYVAFRLRGDDCSVWVAHGASEQFIAEVEKRFAPIAAPPMCEWKDEDRCIRTYTIWPRDRIAEPLYVSRRGHWWLLNPKLAYKKAANQRVDPTSGNARRNSGGPNVD